MSGVAARARTPANEALREIQEPIRQRLDDVVAEMQRIVTDNLPIILEFS